MVRGCDASGRNTPSQLRLGSKLPSLRISPSRGEGVIHPMSASARIRTSRHPRSPIFSGQSTGRIARTRNGGRHRCQPPLSGILPVAARLPHPVPLLLRSAARKTMLATRSGAIRRWFGRPPFGGRPHLESPSSSFLASVETVAVRAMDCISCPDRVRLNSWESRRSVTRVSVHFLVVPARSLPAGLATCLPVPAVRRLRRPMIGS